MEKIKHCTERDVPAIQEKCNQYERSWGAQSGQFNMKMCLETFLVDAQLKCNEHVQRSLPTHLRNYWIRAYGEKAKKAREEVNKRLSIVYGGDSGEWLKEF